MVLIVEDDPRFASILLALVRDSGFKGVVTGEGAAAPSLARRFGPDAIMLDIGLPDMDGLALLDLLKRTPETRHIPVHVISADDQKGLGLSMGAFGFTHKPVEREVVVSTLQEVKSFVDKADRRDRPGRRRGRGGRDRCASASPRCEVVADLAAVAGAGRRPSGPTALVIEAAALPAAAAGRAAEAGRRPLDARRWSTRPTSWSADDDRRLRLAVFGGLVAPGPHARPAGRAGQPAAARAGGAAVRADAKRQAQPDASTTTPCSPAARCVVIDDDIRNIFSLASALEEYGIELSYAESGRAGLELLRRQARRRRGAGGHHDARHGRLRDHPRDPRACPGSPTCRSSRSPPRR